MLIENLTNILDEKTNGQAISTVLNINAKHTLFKGHFPDNPITPGVVLLQFLKEQAENFFGCKLQIVKASNAKFLSVVVPKEENQLRLESGFRTEDDIISADSKIFYEDKICIKARLVFSRA